jgi:mono/diheme cytochrome c family protein
MYRYLKAGLGCFVSVVALIVLLVPNVVVNGNLQKRKTSRAKRVDELFNRNCARCHGADGRSDTPQGRLFLAPDFTDAGWWSKNSKTTNSKALRSVIVRGKAAMPAFGKKLTRSDIDLLVERIRSFRQSERKS